MPQEAGGIPYASTNPTGVGAVYFEPYNAQKQHQDNLDLFLEGVKYRRDAAAKKKEYATKMLGDMAIDPKNIMDTDATALSLEAQDLQNYYAKALQQDIDPENPAFIQANKEFQQKKQALLFKIAQSAAERKLLESSLAKYDPNKHDDITLKRQTEFRMKPLEERSKYAEDLLVNKKPSLVEYLQKYSKPFAEKMQETQEVLPPNKQGQVIEKSLKYSLSPTGDKNDYLAHAQNIISDAEGGKTVDENWALIPDSERQSYVDAYVAQGMPPSVAEVEAKKDWVADNLARFNVIQRSEAYKGETTGYKEGVKFGYGQKKEASQGRVLPEYVAQIKVGDPAVMKKTVYKMPGTDQFVEVYGTRGLNGYNLGSVQLPVIGDLDPTTKKYGVATKDGTQVFEKVENYPTLIFTDQDGNLQLSTVESERLYKVGKMKTPFIPFQTEGALLSYLQSAGGNEQNKQYGTADQQKKYLEQTKASRGGVDYDARVLLGWTDKDEARAEQARGFKVVYKPIPSFNAATQQPAQQQPKKTSASGGTYTIKGKKYTLQQLIDMGYTEQQVAAYKDK